MCEVEKQKREQMREQENMERQALQAAEDAKMLCVARLLFTRPSHFFRVPPSRLNQLSDKPVTIPKAPVFHCDAHLGVLTTVVYKK